MSSFSATWPPLYFPGLKPLVLTGGLGAIGAALYSNGVPKDSVLQYETAIKADGFLVITHCGPEDVARAKDILGTSHPASLEVHSAAKG